MNRTEFMNQLENLLQNISFAEKEEALQYYNDYFDDAGAENEQSVIEDLGSPARVAENIRRELLENQGTGDSTAADRAVVEYGRAEADEETKGTWMSESAETPAGAVPGRVLGSGDTPRYEGSPRYEGRPGYEGSPRYEGRPGYEGSPGYEGTPRYEGSPGHGGSAGSGGSGGCGGEPGTGGKRGRSGGMIALITVLLVFASPFILGLLSMLFGLLMMWFALILSFGVVVLSMFIVLFVLLIVGGMCIPTDPLVGMALIGGGFVCGGIGILFLMLTVAMAGIVTPAIFRGIGHLFRFGRKEAAV